MWPEQMKTIHCLGVDRVSSRFLAGVEIDSRRWPRALVVSHSAEGFSCAETWTSEAEECQQETRDNATSCVATCIMDLSQIWFVIAGTGRSGERNIRFRPFPRDLSRRAPSATEAAPATMFSLVLVVYFVRPVLTLTLIRRGANALPWSCVLLSCWRRAAFANRKASRSRTESCFYSDD